MFKLNAGYITLSILSLIILISVAVYIYPPTFAKGEKNNHLNTEPLIEKNMGKYILIHLNDMTLELKDGGNILSVIPIISKGKPKSYYETIGGKYENDYKEPLHFSSIGFVYMPYSIHIFGNFFIHGIPYFPNGEKVSSAYSGGCIRLNDEDAKTVYDFVSKGTPIIVTNDGEYDFSNTELNSVIIYDMNMTRLMVAVISLEVLTQDNEIVGMKEEITTRRKLLSELIINGNDDVSLIYQKALGESAFIDYMNKKVVSLGMTNTKFDNVLQKTKTTPEDYARFMEYIYNYKSYLLNLSTSTVSL